MSAPFVDPAAAIPNQDMAWKQIAADWQQIGAVFGVSISLQQPFMDPAPQIPNYDMACKQICANLAVIAASL